MKPIIAILLFFSTLAVTAQTLSKGDHLKAAYKKIATPFFFEAPPSTPWAEGKNMLMIGDRPNPNDCDYVFLALRDSTLIGIYKTKQPNYFLFDTQGNSVLGAPTEFFLLPAWIVKTKTRLAPEDKTVLTVFDSLYESNLQADDGQLDEQTIRTYRSLQTDPSLPNRHLLLLLDNYQTLISNTAAQGQQPPADVSVPLMQELTAECQALYQKVPAIVTIYLGEALQSANRMEEARSHFKKALQEYPASIPLQVYNYRLETNPEKKEEQRAALKKKYPRHWMVKDL